MGLCRWQKTKWSSEEKICWSWIVQRRIFYMLISHSWPPKSLIYLILIAFESGGNTNIANFNKGIKQVSKCLFLFFYFFQLPSNSLSMHKKMKSSIKDFFSKCDQILRKLWIWSHLLKKSLMENFIFLCSVLSIDYFSTRYNVTIYRMKMKTYCNFSSTL